VVKEILWHGIGRENGTKEPQVLHYGKSRNRALVLEEGMTFTIEPMIKPRQSQDKNQERRLDRCHRRQKKLSAQMGTPLFWSQKQAMRY